MFFIKEAFSICIDSICANSEGAVQKRSFMIILVNGNLCNLNFTKAGNIQQKLDLGDATVTRIGKKVLSEKLNAE